MFYTTSFPNTYLFIRRKTLFLFHAYTYNHADDTRIPIPNEQYTIVAYVAFRLWKYCYMKNEENLVWLLPPLWSEKKTRRIVNR